MNHVSSSHTTGSILTEAPLAALSCLLYHKGQQSDEYENVYKCKISINVNKLFIVYFVHVRLCRVVVTCLFVYPLFYTALCCCLFISLFPYFFILMLLLYFCLFINHVNKPFIFVFEALVYYFKNTIFIFVTIRFSTIGGWYPPQNYTYNLLVGTCNKKDMLLIC